MKSMDSFLWILISFYNSWQIKMNKVIMFIISIDNENGLGDIIIYKHVSESIQQNCNSKYNKSVQKNINVCSCTFKLCWITNAGNLFVHFLEDILNFFTSKSQTLNLKMITNGPVDRTQIERRIRYKLNANQTKRTKKCNSKILFLNNIRIHCVCVFQGNLIEFPNEYSLHRRQWHRIQLLPLPRRRL